MVSPRAYIRRSNNLGLSVRSGSIWDYTDREDLILDASPDDLLWLDAEDGMNDVLSKFESRFPASRPELTRIMCDVWQRRPESTAIEVSDSEEWYAPYKRPKGTNYFEEMALIARESGPVLCHSPRPEWNSALERFGAYTRNVRGQWCEVVYNPKVTERRIAKRQAKASKRRSKGLQVDELVRVADGLVNLLPDYMEKIGIAVTGGTRYNAVRSLLTALHIVCVTYDKAAHRQSPEWQNLMGVWRDKSVRTATKREWGSNGLWRFLDHESKVRKPRKRKLRGKDVHLPQRR